MSVSAKELLPVGSVVLVNGTEKRLMIIGVYTQAEENGQTQDYDYIGVPYPEGDIEPDLRFAFQHEDIAKLYFRGYRDEERTKMVESMQQQGF